MNGQLQAPLPPEHGAMPAYRGWTRAIVPVTAVLTPSLATTGVEKGEDGLETWLAEQAHAHALSRLLAHADDGVIWGRVDAGVLSTERTES